ncbi:MAG: hypothetical protein ACRCX2_10065 [Paraclostridium sp.]
MIGFFLKNKMICSLSVVGFVSGEISSTKKLLACEHKCDVKDIEVKICDAEELESGIAK